MFGRLSSRRGCRKAARPAGVALDTCRPACRVSPDAASLVLHTSRSRESQMRCTRHSTVIRVLALAIMAFPLLLRCIRTAFEEVPRHLEEAAATLGKTPWQVFSRVSVPLARRGIAAGLVLGFAAGWLMRGLIG